jgi:hypothetical protein
MFVGFFKIIDYIKSKANQVYLKQAKIIQDLMSICTKKINCKKIMLVTTIFWGFSVLSPSCKNCQTDDAIGMCGFVFQLCTYNGHSLVFGIAKSSSN